MELDEYLNKETGGKFEFKLKSAKVSKASGLCFVEMFYKDGVILSQYERKICEEKLKEVLPYGFEYKFKFIKEYALKSSVLQTIRDYFAKNHPSIFYEIDDKERFDGEIYTITFSTEQQEFLRDKRIVDDLVAYVKNSLGKTIAIAPIFKSEEKVEAGIEEYNVSDEMFLPQNRIIEVSEVEIVVGSLLDTSAFYIKDKQSAGEDVVFCGKIGYFRECSYTPKKKEKEDKTEESEVSTEPKERKFFKFSLEDFSGRVNAVFFSNKNNYEQMLSLKQGDSIIVSGKLEEDNYSGGVSLRVKNISRCTLPEKFEEEIVYKSEPKEYKYVFPEPMQWFEQTDLFSLGEAKPTHPALKDKDFVVFDFETTGLEVIKGDLIIEIGAVKIRDGKIIERFMCFVDPKMKIPKRITEITSITDDDVKGAPLYSEALADFYKFTRGATLVGYNVYFDLGFLYAYGKKSAYNFDNPIMDVFKLAQFGVKGVKNYKLKTVAEKLGVTLDNAHRAVFDALATAEVFIKLADQIEKL